MTYFLFVHAKTDPSSLPVESTFPISSPTEHLILQISLDVRNEAITCCLPSFVSRWLAPDSSACRLKTAVLGKFHCKTKIGLACSAHYLSCSSNRGNMLAGQPRPMPIMHLDITTQGNVAIASPESGIGNQGGIFSNGSQRRRGGQPDRLPHVARAHARREGQHRLLGAARGKRLDSVDKHYDTDVL